MKRSLTVLLLNIILASMCCRVATVQAAPRPFNILMAISDDQSFRHTSAAGYKAIETPAFDRIAREGVLFRNAFCGSPGCSPSRASLLTGRYPWMLEHAGTHASSFSSKYACYPNLLEAGGYFVGFTGKGWGPGNWKDGGHKRNPAGTEFNRRSVKKSPTSGISRKDYVANFRDFLEACPEGKPFCFWYGGHEPHRGFEAGSGLAAGKKLADVEVPTFLPDQKIIRSDILDYCLEIEHFDRQLGRMLQLLQQRGELENTIVLVTGDNGMAFPRAKANCYEYGIHVPLAIRWPGQGKPGRVVDDLVSFVDLAPTLLEVAGLPSEPAMTGKSLATLLKSDKSGVVEPKRRQVFSARERHSSSRYQNWTYPQRAMRTDRYLLIRNFRPDRWPAGAPQKLNSKGALGPMHGAYHDIDACPSLTFLVEHHDEPGIAPFFQWSIAKRPAWELFDIHQDPGCLENLIGSPVVEDVEPGLKRDLESFLTQTQDPRILDGGDIFETYRRYSRMRKFPAPPGKP
jgi:uncharacterized sulfatase